MGTTFSSLYSLYLLGRCSYSLIVVGLLDPNLLGERQPHVLLYGHRSGQTDAKSGPLMALLASTLLRTVLAHEDEIHCGVVALTALSGNGRAERVGWAG